MCELDPVSLGSAEEPNDSDMTHSYRLTEGRLIRYPMTRMRIIGVAEGYGAAHRDCLPASMLASNR